MWFCFLIKNSNSNRKLTLLVSFVMSALSNICPMSCGSVGSTWQISLPTAAIGRNIKAKNPEEMPKNNTSHQLQHVTREKHLPMQDNAMTSPVNSRLRFSPTSRNFS